MLVFDDRLFIVKVFVLACILGGLAGSLVFYLCGGSSIWAWIFGVIAASFAGYYTTSLAIKLGVIKKPPKK